MSESSPQSRILPMALSEELKSNYTRAWTARAQDEIDNLLRGAIAVLA